MREQLSLFDPELLGSTQEPVQSENPQGANKTYKIWIKGEKSELCVSVWMGDDNYYLLTRYSCVIDGKSCNGEKVPFFTRFDNLDEALIYGLEYLHHAITKTMDGETDTFLQEANRMRVWIETQALHFNKTRAWRDLQIIIDQ